VEYNWTGPNNFTSNEQNPVVATSGIYTLTVLGSNGCESQDDAIVAIDTLPPVLTLSLDDTLDCNISTVQLSGISTPLAISYNWTGPNNFNSDEQNPVVSEPGAYSLIVTTLNGCSSEELINVQQDFTAPDATAFGDTLNCNFQIIQLNGVSTTLGVSYSWIGPNNFSSTQQNPWVVESGTYFLTVEGMNGCGITINTIVEEDIENPDAFAFGDTLDCNILMVQLYGNSTTPNVFYSWTGPNNFISDEQNPEVTNPGEYFLTVQAENGCVSTASAEVELDNASPDATLIGDTLDCNNPLVQLQGNSITSDVSYSWTGPNNYTSDEQNPEVFDPGEYFLTVEAANGCHSTISIIIELDDTIPDVEAAGDTLDCNNSMVQLQGNSNTIDVTYSWTGPNNFTSDEQNPTVTLPSEYILTIQPANGCEAMDSTLVLQDDDVPNVSAVLGDTLDCIVSLVSIDGNSLTPGVIFSWTGPNNFTSDDQNLEVSDPGEYSLTVTSPNACSSIINVMLSQDIAYPDATAVGDTLNCNILVVQLEGNSITPNVTYSWTGPNNFNSNEQNPQVADSGEYFLTVQALNGCETMTSTIVEEDITFPNAFTIGDTLNCENPIGQIQGNSTTPDISYSWTGPSNFLSDEQNPEVTEPGGYFLTVQAPNGCETTVITIVEEDIDVPDATAFGDTLDCDFSTVSLQGNSNTPGVIYNWTGPNNFISDEQNPEVTDQGEYFLTVLALNGCEFTVSAIVEQDADVPDAVALGDTLNCNNSLVQLQGNSITPNVTYSWTGPNNFISDDQNPNVAQAGVYTLTVLSQNGCEAITNAMVVADFDLPDAIATGDTLDCISNMSQLEGNSITPGVSYSWSGPNNFASNDQNPQVTEAGEYFLIVTAPNGCQTTISAIVEQDDDTPDIMAIGDTLDCIVNQVQLQGNSTNPGVTYSWTGPNNFTSDEQNPQVTEPGEYILTVTAISNCEAVASVFIIEDTSDPNILALTDTISCYNPVAQLQGISATTGVTYSWTGPNNYNSDEQNPQVANPGEYILTISAPNGCYSEMMVGVEDISELIYAVTTSSDTITCENDLAEINAVGSSTGNNIEYLWLDTNNDSIGNSLQQTVTEGGFYTLIVFNDFSGCSAESQIFVEENNNLPFAEAILIGNQSITCQNNSVIISGESSGPLNEVVFEWLFEGNFISDQIEIQVDEAGEYILQITNFTNGCTSFDTIIVEENMQFPEIDIIPPSSLNCIDTIIQVDASNSSVGNDFDYQWISISGNGIQSGQTTLMPWINQPGEYVLVITNNENGCIDSSAVTIDSNTQLPLAEAGDAQDLDCYNQIAFLNGNGSSIGANYNYLWMGNGILNGEDSLMPEINQTGVYSLLVTNTENGCTATDDVMVGGITDFVSNAIVLSNGPDCFYENNGSIQIENVFGGEGPYMYSIGGQPFVQNNIFNGLSQGNYELIIMDASGCEWDTIITLNPSSDIQVVLGEDDRIELGDSFHLDPQVNVSLLQMDTFFWQYNGEYFCDTCFSQWVSPYQTTSYSITVLNESGCFSTDEIVVRVEKSRLVFIPNAFSADNDGNNDIFMIYGGKDVLKVNSFQIYNRWGAAVFEQNDFQPNDPQFGWNGTYKGQTLNPGVFVYFAEIEFIDGRVEMYKGDITLFR